MTHTPASRRICRLLATLAMLAAFTASEVTAQDTLLQNPGFENKGAGWGKFGAAEFEDWAEETGDYGAALWGWIMDGEGGFFQSAPASPGHVYTFSIRVAKEPLFEATNVFLKLEFFGPDDATKSGRDQGMLNIAPLLTTSWQTFTITGTAPLGTAFVRPVFGFSGATRGDLGGGKQACFFDNAFLAESAAPQD